jgi:hypothetical protein
MTVEMARKWLITASLGITAGVVAFFVAAPAFGFPLTADQAMRLLEIVVPVFLGYLGTASRFVFSAPNRVERVQLRRNDPLVALLIRGPLLVFLLIVFVAVASFGWSNRADAPAGAGMSIDALSGVVSTALGLLAVTTHTAVAYLFVARDEAPTANVSAQT